MSNPQPRIRTEYHCPPIPDRSHDWSAIDDNTYCCPECHSPIGWGRTEQEAIEDLIEQINEGE